MKVLLSALLLGSISMPAVAQPTGAPVITPYGAAFATVGAAERPDPKLRYRVVFDVTKAGTDASKPNASLERVARFLNLLAADGVHVQPGDVVAIVYGPATTIVTTDAVYASKTKAAGNPNLPLIAKLKDAGVVVAVCSQALNAHEFAAKDVDPGVRIDVSAITTMATLQLRGWALIQD